ncbi:DUF1622 domain-containing protein [bacterium]|nr:MAG: DUF1622 domain-containing protein [bacterium]
MEALFLSAARLIALVIEAATVLFIAVGAAEAIYGGFRTVIQREDATGFRIVFLRFGSRLILGLEFALAADIVRTAIAPTWDDIGKLAAIAAIRTFLNFFLERDVAKLSTGESTGTPAAL